MRLFDLMRQSSRSRGLRRAVRRTRLELEALESRLVPYSMSGNAWANGELITISFMPDGTSVNGRTSNLFATMNARFGSAATWQNQILKAAQQWAQQTNINFALVADNGAASGSGSYQQGDPGFGDIRIGGYNFGSSTLASAYLPPPVNNYSVAGDIQFNTAQMWNIGSTYDLYTVAMHEIGHALGLYHGPSGTVMYGTYTSARSGLTTDDINGIRNIYSSNNARSVDAYDATASNNTSSAASDLTSEINPLTKAGVINNLDLTTTFDTDWYQFVVPAGSSSTLKVKVQSNGLSLLAPSVAIYDSTLSLKAFASGNNAHGTTVTAFVTGIAAGQTYYVKVASNDAIAAFRTGRYGLIVNMGTGVDPTVTLPDTQTPNGTPLTAGGGQALSITPDIQVNTTSASSQQTTPGGRAVAIDDQGNYVITWASDHQDGSGWGVYAQRFNSSGVAQGKEFRVNTTTTEAQTNPVVAMDASGNFVITWSSNKQDGSGWGIYGQRYNAAGAALGGEFRINTTTAGNQTSPAVAMDSLGNFVVTWTSAGQDGSGLGVYGRLYNALGLSLLGEFRINTTTTGDQTSSTVAMNRTTGDFVVAWASNKQDGSDWGIYARRYNAAGLALGSEFRVNTTTADDQTNPAVAINWITGDFLITWTSDNDDSNEGIYAQRYNALGVALEGEFRVNTSTGDDPDYSAVAVDAAGNYLITWSSDHENGSGWDIYGQQITASGMLLEEELQINTITAGDQRYASVAISALGQAVVAWTGLDANGSGVFFHGLSLTTDGLHSEEHSHADSSGADTDEHSAQRPGQGPDEPADAVFRLALESSVATMADSQVQQDSSLGDPAFGSWSERMALILTNSTAKRLPFRDGNPVHRRAEGPRRDWAEQTDAVFADPAFLLQWV